MPGSYHTKNPEQRRVQQLVIYKTNPFIKYFARTFYGKGSELQKSEHQNSKRTSKNL
jgi:hypothetical protein